MKLLLGLLLLSTSGWGRNVPTLLSVPTPFPAVTLPAYADVFLPPTTTAGTSAGATTICAGSAYLEDGLAGLFFGNNINALNVWTQTSAGNGTWLTGTALSVTYGASIFNMPPTTNLNSAYLSWGSTVTGGELSRPIASGVATEFYSDQQGNTFGPIAVSDTISVYGTLMSYSGVTPLVVVSDDAATSLTCAPIAYDFGKITFKVPALPVGVYHLWTTNCHGGDFGWSGPLYLTIGAATTLSTTAFNVVTAGADPTGATDSWAAISHTVEAAELSSTSSVLIGVSIPAGTYLISQGIKTKGNDYIFGAGMAQTTIRTMPGFTGSYGIGDSNGSKHVNEVFKDLCLDASTNTVNSTSLNSNSNYLFQLTYVQNAAFVRVSICAGLNSFNGTSLTAIGCKTGGSTNITGPLCVSSCVISAYGMISNFPNGTNIFGCTFYGKYDGGNLGSSGVVGAAIERCITQDFDPNDVNGHTGGRFVDFSCSTAGNRNIYVAYNIANIGVDSTKVDQNSGEHGLAEFGANTNGQQVTATSATLNTLTITNDAGSLYNTGYWYACVVHGYGQGQIRRVTGDVAGLMSTEFPWLAIPDATSSIVMCPQSENLLFLSNTFGGNGRKASSSGLELFGAGNKVWGVSNSLSGTSYGIYTQATSYEPNQVYTLGINYWIGNTIDSMLTDAILEQVHYNSTVTTKLGSRILGNIFLKNEISNPASYSVLRQIIDDNGGFGSSTEIGINGSIIQGTTGFITNAALGQTVSDTAGVRSANTYTTGNFWNVRGVNVIGKQNQGSNVTGANVIGSGI